LINGTSAATDKHLSGIKNSGDPHRIYFVFKTLAENNIYNINVDANRPTRDVDILAKKNMIILC